jgi:hypothetical protein
MTWERLCASSWLPAALAVCMSGCQATPEPRDEAIVVEQRLQFPVERTFTAFEQTLADRKLSVLFAYHENGILAFEWPTTGGTTGARARTVARLSSTEGGTSVNVRTSGYLPSSSPAEINLGVDVGPKWIGRSDQDSKPERDLLVQVEARCRGE